jgi:hypothetical protein
VPDENGLTLPAGAFELNLPTVTVQNHTHDAEGRPIEPPPVAADAPARSTEEE